MKLEGMNDVIKSITKVKNIEKVDIGDNLIKDEHMDNLL